MNARPKLLLLSFVCAVPMALTACAIPQQPISTGHIQERAQPPTPPPPIVRAIAPPAVRAIDRKKIDTYSVVVKDVELRDLLFSLARDAKVDVDISPDVKGSVTLNAVNQSLPQILERLSANFDMAFEVVDGVYRITTDKPVLRSYRVEYPNISRKSSSETKLSALDGGINAGTSKTEVTTNSENEFWKTLTKNIEDILRDTDKELVLRKRTSNQSANTPNRSAAPSYSSATSQALIEAALKATGASTNPTNANANAKPNNEEVSAETLVLFAAQVIVNPESGILQVRATARQHAKVKEFLDLILSSSRRQVLIEATVAEVQLTQKYDKGIDWKVFGNNANSTLGLGAFGTGFRNATSGRSLASLNADGTSTLELGLGITGSQLDFLSSLRLLEEFGQVKVLSSPKISVLNNQTAMLKVADNLAYFTVTSTTTDATTTTAGKTTYSTTLNNIPVGFVMSVTPFIGNDGAIQLNIRPSISRIINYVNDPNPALKSAGITNAIPVIRTRELESIMRVSDGNVAVLGGLMEDTISGDLSGIPGLTRGAAGTVLANQADKRTKSELVIFIRPRIVRHADLSGDYQDFQRYLLDEPRFQEPHPALIEK